MGRHDESFDDDFERASETGRANLECITEMRKWCRHFKVEMQSSGLFAQMANLPIGWHDVSCPYTHHGGGGGNLRWSVNRFLVEACDGCPHREPTGDDSWGTAIISEHHEQVRVRAEEERRRADEINRLRSELRAQSQSIGTAAKSESQRIAEFLESIFSDDREERESAAQKLLQAAQLGADLFPDAAVDLLVGLFANDEFNDTAIAVCAELASRRPDLAAKLEAAALDAIRSRRRPHDAASILVRLGESVTYPIDPDCSKCLLLSQYHDIPIGGWMGRPGDYVATTEVLVKSFDADTEGFLTLLRPFLEHENDELRKHFCGALNLLQQKRPAIVEAVLPELMKSLNRHEKKDITHGGPSGKIIQIFQWTFRNAPERIDAFLGDHFERVRPTVQEDIVRVYRDQFFDRDVDWSERRARKHTDNVSEAESVAINRLLTWIKNDQLEPETRQHAADALEIACIYATGAMIPQFDTILGYYALLCERDDPPAAPPRIVLPGEREDPTLIRLQASNRKQHWGFFKGKVVQCLEELCKARPREVFDAVHGCLSQPSAHLGDEFRATVVTLLGELGSTFGLQDRALPILMRELMNYGSAWVRAKAIQATVEMFHSTPPSNVVDVMLVHLRDPKVIVHQAAVRAVDRRAWWFDSTQAPDALLCLAALARAYRDDPFELEHVCEAAIALAHQNIELKPLAIMIVESVFPTKEEHVDQKIAEEMERLVKPDDGLASRVALHIATYLAMHDRDRFNGSMERDRMWRWMHSLSQPTVASIADRLLPLASDLAGRDFWESWHFASLFAKNGLFSHEEKVLELIRSSYPNEPKFDDIRRDVVGLTNIAAANQSLQGGDSSSAKSHLTLAMENLA